MTAFQHKKLGVLNVDHGSTTTQPSLAVISFQGGDVVGTIKFRVVEAEVAEFWRLVHAVFEEGKRERSLEIQKVLNGGEENISKHNITITDKRNG